MKVANPAEPVNDQDKRALPAALSPARFCSPAVKGRQPEALPSLTIIKGNYQPAFMKKREFYLIVFFYFVLEKRHKKYFW